jgi:hypothetical protein
MTPEEFSISASNDGERYLDCPGCGWYTEFESGRVGPDLRSLLAVAAAHIAEKHPEEQQ